MKTRDTQAIILQTRDFGESDRIVTFFTKSGGKLKGIAKGARRSRRRFVNTFELFSLVDLTYGDRRSLIWIDACKLVEPHLALRTEVERWGYAALVSEILMEMVPEGEPQHEIFLLLNETLRQLSEDKDPLNVVLLFIFRFLDLSGYLPSLENCNVCGRPLKSCTQWWWRMQQGTLACTEHRTFQEQCIMLDLGTLILIRQLRDLPVDKVWRLRLLQEKKAPLLQGVLDWVRHHIRRDLKSLKLLEQVHTVQMAAQ